MAGDFGAFRGASVAPPENSMALGGNMKNSVGSVTSGQTTWHPTVVYLLALLVVEWVVFGLLAKYL